jgi:hypothetical protein
MSKMLSKSLLASFLGPLLAAAQLNELAQKAGKLYFGTATDNGELSNTTYLSILSNTSQFGQLTPGNGMKVLPPPHFPFLNPIPHFLVKGRREDVGRIRGKKKLTKANSGNTSSPNSESSITQTEPWLRTWRRKMGKS